MGETNVEGIGWAAQMIARADSVLVAASNGFDIADGYNQFACDEPFLRAFGDFHVRYGLASIIQGLASRWPSWEERWAFLARVVTYGCVDYRPTSVMRAVLGLLRGRRGFVVTCNCNGRFEQAGVAPGELLETEGSYARLRCSAGCSDDLFDATPHVRRIRESAPGAVCVPTELVPRCPHCGAPLDVAVDDRGGLASTTRHQSQQRSLRRFLDEARTGETVVLELGVGQRNQAIKRPLMAWAAAEPRASYVVLNREPAVLPQGMGNRALGISDDLGPVLLALADALGTSPGAAAGREA